jgi:hypothetical protein
MRRSGCHRPARHAVAVTRASRPDATTAPWPHAGDDDRVDRHGHRQRSCNRCPIPRRQPCPNIRRPGVATTDGPRPVPPREAPADTVARWPTGRGPGTRGPPRPAPIVPGCRRPRVGGIHPPTAP